MIYEDIEFFNVECLRQAPGLPGLRLERFPEDFRQRLGDDENHKGRYRCSRVHGCELRFVTGAAFADLALMALEGDLDVWIYCGDNLHSRHTLKAGVTTVLHLEKPETISLVEEERLEKVRFAPQVWRALLGLNASLQFLYLDTFGYSRRPPCKEELPEFTWLAYGSSITCGSKAWAYPSAYVNQAALRLHADVMNKGLSGTCRCEGYVADYIAAQQADVLTLELGINMINTFSPEEFTKRVHYLLETIRKNSAAKHVFVMDMFRNKAAIYRNKQAANCVNYPVFCGVVEREATAAAELDGRFHYIEGKEIGKDLSYLTVDFLHPSDEGHCLMGEKLANAMKRFII